MSKQVCVRLYPKSEYLLKKSEMTNTAFINECILLSEGVNIIKARESVMRLTTLVDKLSYVVENEDDATINAIKKELSLLCSM